MEKIDILPQSIFKFECDQKLLENTLETLKKEEYRREGVHTHKSKQTVSVRLDKEERYSEIYDWFHQCLEEARVAEGLQCESLKISLSWANWAPPQSGAGHPMHRHNYAYYSAVYYLTEGSPTVFLDPVDIRGLDTLEILQGDRESVPNEKEIVAEPGKLILFPGWLRHCSAPHHQDFNRFTISFNSLPDGAINGGPGGVPVATLKIL